MNVAVFIAITVIVVSASHDHWHQVSAVAPGAFGDDASAHPHPRRNAAVWCLPEDVLYVLGGRTEEKRTADLWRYEEAADRWFWLGTGPHAVSGAAHWVSPGTPFTLYLYGGRTDDGAVYGELWAYTIAAREWAIQESAAGRVTPGPRYGAVTWYNEATATLYLYGGKNASHAIQQDLWTLDTRSATWSLAAASNAPGIRDDGAATSRGNIAYMLGGEGAGPQLWTFDMDAGTWTSVAGPPIPGGGDVQDHVMWLDPRGATLLVAGGKLATDEVNDDIWSFSIHEQKWHKAASTPTARWGAGSCLDPEGYLFMFGGVSGQRTYLNDVWKYGQLYSRIEEILRGDTLQATTAAAMSTLTFVVLVVAIVVWVVCWCVARRRKVHTESL